MPAEDQKADAVAVSCRPARSNWLIVIALGIYSGMAAMAAYAPPPKGLPSPADTVAWESIAALCLLASLGITWWLLRGCVIGDCDGLRWRGLGGWKSARWDEFSDYYEKLPTPFQRGSRVSSSSGTRLPSIVSMIETSSGNFGVTSAWSNANVLRELVEQQAVHSRASHWGLKGTRAIDSWPRVFDYNTLENRWAPRLWFKLFLTFVFYLLIQPALQLTVMAGMIGWTTTLVMAGLYLLLVGSIGLIFLIPLVQYRGANHRKAEHITVELTGIVFENGSRRIEANWPDVMGYWLAPSQGLTVRSVVETRSGEFDFLSNLSHAVLLQEIIRRFATEAADQQWRPRVNHAALAGEAARWTGGKFGVGAHVYHYRIRMNRALLWIPLALCLMCGLMAWVAGQGLSPGRAPGQSVLGYMLSGATSAFALLLGYYAYRTCRIESDEEGLTQIMLWGKRRLRWSQIENYYLTRERSGVVVGRAERITFSSQIVGYEELKEEITRRATERGGKMWEKAEELKTPR